MDGQRAVRCAILPRRRSKVAVRVRAWLIACATLLILLVPIGIAGSALTKPDRGSSTFAADVRFGGELAAAPPQASSVPRQAYALLLDNFVSPPSPSSLLGAAAAEVGKR